MLAQVREADEATREERVTAESVTAVAQERYRANTPLATKMRALQSPQEKLVQPPSRDENEEQFAGEEGGDEDEDEDESDDEDEDDEGEDEDENEDEDEDEDGAD